MNYTFSQDWFTPWCLPVWPDLFKEQGLIGKPDIEFLEVGSFEGRASTWLIENVLTNPTSRLTCIDTFEGSAEHAAMGVDNTGLFERFRQNIAETGQEDRVYAMVGTSAKYLPWLHFFKREYDCIYLDGSHAAPDVLSDVVLCWGLLKSGGLLICDDYNWPLDLPEIEKPKIALDSFLSCFVGQYKILRQEYQLILLKL